MTGALRFVRARGWEGRRSAQDRVQPWLTEADRMLLGGSFYLRLFPQRPSGSPAKPARPPPHHHQPCPRVGCTPPLHVVPCPAHGFLKGPSLAVSHLRAFEWEPPLLGMPPQPSRGAHRLIQQDPAHRCRPQQGSPGRVSVPILGALKAHQETLNLLIYGSLSPTGLGEPGVHRGLCGTQQVLRKVFLDEQGLAGQSQSCF